MKFFQGLTNLFRKKASILSPPTVRIHLYHDEDSGNVAIDSLILNKPDGNGAPLINFNSLVLQPGDCMMLSGPAGCGKTSALCAMKGAWLFGGSGSITLPPNPQVKFVPQDDYFVDRTLRGIVCAPNDPSEFTDDQVKDALREAELGDLIGDMDDADKGGDAWRSTLSGGQKKKVAIASVFLHAPQTKVLILDEITSALDAQSEETLYAKIVVKMKHGIIISIVHRPEIAAMHNIYATVADGQVTYRRDVKGNTADPAPVSPPKI